MTIATDLDRKIASTLGDLTIDKEQVRRLKIRDTRTITTFVEEWLVSRYDQPGREQGEIFCDISAFMSKHLPTKNEKETIKNRLLTGESVVLLDHFSVRIDLKKGKRLVKIPCLEEERAETSLALLDEHPDLMSGGQWGAGRLNVREEDKGNVIELIEFRPMQSGRVNLEALIEARHAFSTAEWLGVLLRTMGYEPDAYKEHERRSIVLRLLPLVHKNLNLMELAPKGTVMLANQNDVAGQRFRDGVLTRRGTFQKYYTQAEIKAFLEAALEEEPIPVAPGVLYVFRDKDAEQRFLVDRYRGRRNLLRGPSVMQRERSPRPRRERFEERYQTYRDPLERLWERWVSLGRKPDKTEVEDLVTLTEGFGGLARALRFVEERKDIGEVERSRDARTSDLEVYLALNQFERRRPYKHLERGLQRDIKIFFGDYAGAQTTARATLFRIADVDAIEADCRHAAEHGLGWLELGDGAEQGGALVPQGAVESRGSLTLHTSMVEQLPPLLRIYVGCAAVLYGDYRNADLVKIHIGSGKVSLMRYDDFEGNALPRMVERVKIKLREQNIDYFAYGDEYEPPFLYRKSRCINEEFPNYPEQVACEDALEGLGLFDFAGYGPRPGELLATLAPNRWSVEGFDLVRSTSIPDLDDPCGRYLTFRQLIECGETQARTGLQNLPKRPESWNALHDLAVQVLDPVIDYFGMIRLDFGFCSPELAREIPGRIDPKRDQHAACEHNRRGQPVCERLGAAVDFIVDDESMLEVAQWIVANTPFDRLYFYGDDLPLHVSYGPERSRQVVRMVAGKSGRLIPRVTSVEEFVVTP